MVTTNALRTKRKVVGGHKAALRIETTVVFLHATVLCIDATVVCKDASVVYLMKPFVSLEQTVVYSNKEILPSKSIIVFVKQLVSFVLCDGGSSVGYALAGIAVARAAKTTYREAMNDRLLGANRSSLVS